VTTPKLLGDDVWISAFVPPGELSALAPRFRTIINNRSDGEEPGQPSSAEISAEALRLGLDYAHVPVVPGKFGEEQLLAFMEASDNSQGPILAFCKTGRRAASLWALAEAKRSKRSIEEILAAAAAAGHDLCGMRPALGEARQK
jgi:uncharacterized protein (TIGR01244 family)